MAKLTLELAPAASLPRRFLGTVPWWGMLAGMLVLLDGEAMLQSRWHAATLAATHAFTLGVLGNAMFGSMLQFLPAAAGVRLRAPERFGAPAHALLNIGLILLVAGLYWQWTVLMAPAAALLLAAFALLAAMTLPGLIAAHGRTLLRMGLGAALTCALLAAMLGAVLALGLGGWTTLPPPALVDAHAAWGLLGWNLLLTASVARVVMPMFQGTGTVPALAQAIWLAATVLVLLAGSALWLTAADSSVLRAGIGVVTACFAFAALWLQWRAPRSRNATLRAFWRSGLIALAAAAGVLPFGDRDGVAAGVLAIAVALPLLTIGMLLQIGAFLAWLDLHRRCGRGVNLPGVQQLLPEIVQVRVLRSFELASLLLLAAMLWPSVLLTRLAALAMFASYALLWSVQRGVRRRADRFVFWGHPDLRG